MDNANARLAKDRNGGDIPNVALFLKPWFVRNNKTAALAQYLQNAEMVMNWLGRQCHGAGYF